MILSQGRQIANQVLTEQIAKGSDPAEKLRLAIKSHIYLSEAMQTWFYFTYIEARNLPREEQKRAIASELYTEKLFIDIIEDGIAAGIFREGNVILAASVIKAMLQDWYMKRWKYKAKKNIGG